MSMVSPLPKLSSADAARLARFTHPTWPTGDRIYWTTPEEHKKEWLAEDPANRSVSSLPTALGSLNEGGDCITIFRAWSLDNLAQAEQRVVAAGPEGAHFLHTFAQKLCWHLDAQRRPDQLIAFMDAEQRARALLELLDAHPELEGKP